MHIGLLPFANEANKMIYLVRVLEEAKENS